MKNGSMRAVGVFPGKHEVGLLSHPSPRVDSPTQVKIRTLEVGVCGTDREICSFSTSASPYGWHATRLIAVGLLPSASIERRAVVRIVMVPLLPNVTACVSNGNVP